MSKNEFLAYGPDRHALEAVMRMHSVKRWHMIDTTRQQTLAEHSCNVAMLVRLMLAENPMLNDGKRITDAGIVCAALAHDLPESFTGDIPTHTKRHLSGIMALEDKVCPPAFMVDLMPEHKLLVKMCDVADGIRFIRLHGVDLTARHAREGLEKQFAALYNDACAIWIPGIATNVYKSLSFYAYENS